MLTPKLPIHPNPRRRLWIDEAGQERMTGSVRVYVTQEPFTSSLLFSQDMLEEMPYRVIHELDLRLDSYISAQQRKDLQAVDASSFTPAVVQRLLCVSANLDHVKVAVTDDDIRMFSKRAANVWNEGRKALIGDVIRIENTYGLVCEVVEVVPERISVLVWVATN